MCLPTTPAHCRHVCVHSTAFKHLLGPGYYPRPWEQTPSRVPAYWGAQINELCPSAMRHSHFTSNPSPPLHLHGHHPNSHNHAFSPKMLQVDSDWTSCNDLPPGRESPALRLHAGFHSLLLSACERQRFSRQTERLSAIGGQNSSTAPPTPYQLRTKGGPWACSTKGGLVTLSPSRGKPSELLSLSVLTPTRQLSG